VLERVLAPLARRWAWVATALKVQGRFQEVHGGYLAAAVTLTMFLSLFPLLLVLVAVVGLISSREMDLASQVVSRLGLTDDTVTRAVNGAIAQAERSRRGASLIGVAGLLWSGLGVVAALQYAFDNVWQVSGRGLRDKLGGLVWLAGSGLILVASFALTVVVNFVPLLAPLTVPLGVVVNLTLWLWTLKELTNVGAGWRAHLPGGVLGAVGLEVLKVVGAVYVPKAVASSSALYGSIGIVFAILAWLFLLGRLTVYCAALNVVRWEEEHGTVTAEIELPKHPDLVPVEATRAGEAKSPA
jgi:membrane protein